RARQPGRDLACGSDGGGGFGGRRSGGGPEGPGAHIPHGRALWSGQRSSAARVRCPSEVRINGPSLDGERPWAGRRAVKKARLTRAFFLDAGKDQCAPCRSRSCRSEEHTSELQSRENLVCR